MKKAMCLLLSALFVMVMAGCGANRGNPDHGLQQLAKLEVYSGNGDLINTIADKNTLKQFSSFNDTNGPSDSDLEQRELENKIGSSRVLYTIISYKEPVAMIHDGELEKLVEMTVYEDSNIIREQVAPENVKVAHIPEEYLTFYMTISDEEKDFILSLAEI